MSKHLEKLIADPASEVRAACAVEADAPATPEPILGDDSSASARHVLVPCPLCVAQIALIDGAGAQNVVCDRCGLYCQLQPPAPPPAAPDSAPPPPTASAEPEPNDPLERWLAGKPIEPRTPGRLEQLRQWRRQQPLLASAALLAACALAAAGIVAAGFHLSTLRQLSAQRTAAIDCSLQSEQIRDDLQHRIRSAEASARAADARYAQARRDALLTYAQHLAWRSEQVAALNRAEAIQLAAESLTIAVNADAHPPAAAHQNLRNILSDEDGRLLRGHTDNITALAAGPDGQWLASASIDGTVRLWPLAQQHPSRAGMLLGGHLGSVNSLAFTADRRWLATGGNDSTVRFWDITAADPARSPWVLRAKTSRIGALVVSPDNRWVAASTVSERDEPGTVRLWDLASDDAADVSIEAHGHAGPIHVLAVSPDSRWLMSAGATGAVRLWRLGQQRALASATTLKDHPGPVRAAAFSADGRWLAAAGGESSHANVCLWRLEGGAPSSPVVLAGHQGPVAALDVDRDSRWLATAGKDSTIRLWDLRADNPAADPITLAGHEGPANVVKISPDGRWIVSGGEDRSVRLWSLADDGPDASGIVLRKHDAPLTALAVGASGGWFASAAGAELRLWTMNMNNLIELARRSAEDDQQRLYIPDDSIEHVVEAAKPPLLETLPPLPAAEEPAPATPQPAAATAEKPAVEGGIDFSSYLR